MCFQPSLNPLPVLLWALSLGPASFLEMNGHTCAMALDQLQIKVTVPTRNFPGAWELPRTLGAMASPLKADPHRLSRKQSSGFLSAGQSSAMWAFSEHSAGRAAVPRVLKCLGLTGHWFCPLVKSPDALMALLTGCIHNLRLYFLVELQHPHTHLISPSLRHLPG